MCSFPGYENTCGTMSLFWLLSLLFLAAAFGVLVWTFVWVARLLARCSAESEGEREAEALPPQEDSDPAEEEEDDEEEEEKRRTGTGVNATLGFILSMLACLFFWVSPLVLAVSLGGLYFSGNAFYYGFRWFGVFIPRAILGLVAGMTSVVLQFGYLSGQFTLPL